MVFGNQLLIKYRSELYNSNQSTLKPRLEQKKKSFYWANNGELKLASISQELEMFQFCYCLSLDMVH